MGEPEKKVARGEEGPLYDRPKILGVDLPIQTASKLRDAGFNIVSGTFGTPMQDRGSDRYVPVPVNGRLPNASEREIIIADLESPAPDPEFRPADPPVGEGIWQRMDTGVLDPRPFTMDYARQKYFERIFQHGGAFVVFAAPRTSPRYEMASGAMLGYGTNPHLDNWSLISDLRGLNVEADQGGEIRAAAGLHSTLAAALEEATFTCTVEPEEWAKERWVTLATNKYDKPVSGMLVPARDDQGLILVLPRVVEKSTILRLLLEDLLPSLAPKLFPEDERQIWTTQTTYALPGVSNRRREIVKVESAAAAEVKRLKEEIEVLEAEHAYLHELLTASGSDLVAAVKRTLESLGLSDVRDVDQEEGQVEGRLREDLQIWREPTPIALVEVKGIYGMPKDDDVFQVLKNVPPRIKEWKRFDVRSLAVFNHQRGLPPHERVQQPFQKAQVDHAAHEDLGLITTWDLYRLARGYVDNGWKSQDLASLLTETNGLVEAIPNHYLRVGKIENYFERPGVIAIKLDEGMELKVGERLAFVLPTEFYEEAVESIQVDGQNLDTGPAGAEIGVKTGLGKKRARPGVIAYRVARQ